MSRLLRVKDAFTGGTKIPPLGKELREKGMESDLKAYLLSRSFKKACARIRKAHKRGEDLKKMKADYAVLAEWRHSEEGLATDGGDPDSIAAQILNAIEKSKAPLVSYKDFLEHIPSYYYNELRTTMKYLREHGWIERRTTGYRLGKRVV
jgi:predicted transcriptional regulator